VFGWSTSWHVTLNVFELFSYLQSCGVITQRPLTSRSSVLSTRFLLTSSLGILDRQSKMHVGSCVWGLHRLFLVRVSVTSFNHWLQMWSLRCPVLAAVGLCHSSWGRCFYRVLFQTLKIRLSFPCWSKWSSILCVYPIPRIKWMSYFDSCGESVRLCELRCFEVCETSLLERPIIRGLEL
jgi:hypothetical protein